MNYISDCNINVILKYIWFHLDFSDEHMYFRNKLIGIISKINLLRLTLYWYAEPIIHTYTIMILVLTARTRML
jgi:hypothetical protein